MPGMANPVIILIELQYHALEATTTGVSTTCQRAGRSSLDAMVLEPLTSLLGRLLLPAFIAFLTLHAAVPRKYNLVWQKVLGLSGSLAFHDVLEWRLSFETYPEQLSRRVRAL